MDIDQYDTDDAAYFILLEDDGAIAASARINRTMQSSLLADLFPFLIETAEAPRAEGLFEGTRFIIAPRSRRRSDICRARARLVSAVVEYCLQQGGTHLQAVIDTNMLSSFVEMTLRTRPLGLSHDYGGGAGVRGGGSCLAFRWDLSAGLLDDLNAYGEFDAHEQPELAQLDMAH